VRHLDGHAPLQALVVCQVDDPEAAVSQDRADAIAADALGKFVMGAPTGGP